MPTIYSVLLNITEKTDQFVLGTVPMFVTIVYPFDGQEMEAWGEKQTKTIKTL